MKTKAARLRRLKAIRDTLDRADARASVLRQERVELWQSLRDEVAVKELADLSGVSRVAVHQFFKRQEVKES